jgi:hypothetical protein
VAAELDIGGILATLIREEADDFTDEELPDPLDPEILAQGGNWVLSTRLGRFDVMQWIDDEALWEDLSPKAIEAEVGDLTVKFASYEDLTELKERAGRPEDVLDLQRLRQARGEE